MNFSFLAALLPLLARVELPALPAEAPPVVQAIRAVGDYAEALRKGDPVDEEALAYARCVLEHDGQPGFCADLAPHPAGHPAMLD